MHKDLKVHKNENYFCSDFEFCIISLLVMHKNIKIFGENCLDFYGIMNIIHNIEVISTEKDCGLTILSRLTPSPPLTGANPLLTHTGTLGCWVSPLAHCVPP